MLNTNLSSSGDMVNSQCTIYFFSCDQHCISTSKRISDPHCESYIQIIIVRNSPTCGRQNDLKRYGTLIPKTCGYIVFLAKGTENVNNGMNLSNSEGP